MALDSTIVRRIQSRVGVSQDGILGPITLTAIDLALTPAASSEVPKSGTAANLDIGDRIVAVAIRYLNLVETQSNAQWDDPKTPGVDARALQIRAALIASGHTDGAPYCAAFVEAIWRLAYAEAGARATTIARLTSLLCPSVMTSFMNWKREGLITQTPVKGAIFFMQKGESWTGHAGIVRAVKDGYIETIEGNTSPMAGTPEADRNGDGIYAKQRRLQFTMNTSGLWLRGFLNPITP
jgi:hypothetical protein